jgi:hypothetical protein
VRDTTTSMVTLSRDPEQFAHRLEENWSRIREFFASRNWPDTIVGRAAADLNGDMPTLLATLRSTGLTSGTLTLTRVVEKLKRAGATLPAPEPKGSVESSMLGGLCVALAVVQQEVEGSHPQTERCGFDRDSSISEDRYVCTCDWREPHKVRPAVDKSFIASAVS